MSQTITGETCLPSAKPKSLGWASMQVILLALAGGAGVFAGLCWRTGAVEPLAGIQTGALLATLIILNLAPPLAELAYKRFDPFDAKHLFLGYFFLILTVHSFFAIVFGLVVNPGLAATMADESVRVRALAAITLGLAAFVTGCYLPLGRLIARILPRIVTRVSVTRIRIVALGCLGFGGLAFYWLMASAGGIASFLANLGTWRTVGVLNGVGYLTFPITGLLPAAMLLLLLYTLPGRKQRLTWRAVRAVALATASLVPILILGFRVSLVPVILFFLAAWHYVRRFIRINQIIALGAALVVLLTLFSLVRGGQWTTGDTKAALLFRVPGLDIVERVVGRLDLGEPHHGIRPMLIESATIMVPRAIWPAKPAPTGLAFCDIFFSDFFIGRGDPIDGIKSGVSPTFIGEMLWVDGISAVVLGALVLGVAAQTAVVWRQRGRGHRLHIFAYAIFMAFFPIFAEAPQLALNDFAMFSVMTLGLVLLLTVRLRSSRGTTPS
jgi:hypothetical protein